MQASDFTVAAGAAEVRDRVSSDLQQLLDLQISLDVTDQATDKVTLDVNELSGLGAKFIDPAGSVNLVDAATAVTGHAGVISVNRVTLVAEADGQDLRGIDIDGLDRNEPANVDLGGYTGVVFSVDQVSVEMVGVGSYSVADTGPAIQSAMDSPDDMLLVGASSVVVTEGQATLSVDQYSMLEASGNIADTKDFAVVDSVWRINDGGIDFSAPASVTAVVDPVDTDLTYFGSLATNATDLDLSQATNVRVTVEQVNGLNITNGSYDVVDSAGPIEDNIAEIDGAQNVYSNDVLTLTVAEYNALDDEDTDIATGYRIVDEAANIEAEMTADGSYLGVLSNIKSFGTTDVPATLTIAQYDALAQVMATSDFYGSDFYSDLDSGHYVIADTGSAIDQKATELDPSSLPPSLVGASSVVVTEGQATLSVDQYSMLEASGNIADTKDFAVVDSVWRINDGGIDFSAPASVTAVVDPVDTDLTYFGSLATNATDLDLSQATNVRVTVEQVNGLNITNGSYDVVDSAGPIEDNIAEIDGAQNVYSNDVLTLTVAEYNALDDEDTDIATGYRIVDEAANIEAEMTADGSYLGVLSNIKSFGTTDVPATLTIAQYDALAQVMATSDFYGSDFYSDLDSGHYVIADTGSAIDQKATELDPSSLPPSLVGASSVVVTGARRPCRWTSTRCWRRQATLLTPRTSRLLIACGVSTMAVLILVPRRVLPPWLIR